MKQYAILLHTPVTEPVLINIFNEELPTHDSIQISLRLLDLYATSIGDWITYKVKDKEPSLVMSMIIIQNKCYMLTAMDMAEYSLLKELKDTQKEVAQKEQ